MHHASFGPVSVPASLMFTAGTLHLPLGPKQRIVHRLGLLCHHCLLSSTLSHTLQFTVYKYNKILVDIKKKRKEKLPRAQTTHDASFGPVSAPASLTFVTGTFHLPLGPGQCIVHYLGLFCHHHLLSSTLSHTSQFTAYKFNIILVSIKKREKKTYLVARKKKGKAYFGPCFMLHCQWVQVIIKILFKLQDEQDFFQVSSKSKIMCTSKSWFDFSLYSTSPHPLTHHPQCYKQVVLLSLFFFFLANISILVWL